MILSVRYFSDRTISSYNIVNNVDGNNTQEGTVMSQILGQVKRLDIVNNYARAFQVQVQILLQVPVLQHLLLLNLAKLFGVFLRISIFGFKIGNFLHTCIIHGLQRGNTL